MTASRDKPKAGISKKKEKLHGAPREQRRQWQTANGKSWNRRPQKKNDGWL